MAAVHRFAALIIASAVAITPAQAQTASELRISGTVEKLDGNLAALSLSRGISLVVRLDSEPRVNSVAKGSGSDLKAGSQVSIQAKSGQSGDLIATQIVLFAPGSNRPDAEPACTGFTHVMARRVARPPKAAFVTRLRSGQLPNPTARQLPDLSTTIWVEPSSTGDTRHRGALNGDSFRLAHSKRRSRRARSEPPSDAAPQE